VIQIELSRLAELAAKVCQPESARSSMLAAKVHAIQSPCDPKPARSLSLRGVTFVSHGIFPWWALLILFFFLFSFLPFISFTHFNNLHSLTHSTRLSSLSTMPRAKAFSGALKKKQLQERRARLSGRLEEHNSRTKGTTQEHEQKQRHQFLVHWARPLVCSSFWKALYCFLHPP